MIILVLLGLLALVSTVFADVAFNLIGFPKAASNSFAVEINNKLYPLRTSKTTYPLWTGVVIGASSASNYRYVELSNKGNVVESEKFQRDLNAPAGTATLNEFFGRQTTVSKLPAIKQIYEDVRPEPSRVFDDSQIATIHLTVDQAAFENILHTPLEKHDELSAGFMYINANTVYSVNSVKLRVAGRASRKYDKVSLGLEFDTEKGETFFNRPIIKLRAQRTDSSMMSEKLYIDVLNSAGVPTAQGSYVRVYANSKPVGFFLMVEDIESPFFMNTVHHGEIKDPSALGSLFKINSGKLGSGRYSALTYEGAHTSNYDIGLYKNQILGDNPEKEPMKQLITFMKDLQDWNPASAGGIEFWNKHLDLQGFLRAMAVEYLTGAWDLFWFKANNYFMYFNPQLKVWQFIPTDFDHTFSSFGREGIDTTYKDYGYTLPNGKKPNIPLVDKVIYENKDTNREFEEILLAITKGVFNPEVLDARIDAYVDQIEDDVSWDFSIDRSRFPGKDPAWTVAKFKKVSTAVKNKGLKVWIRNRSKSVFKELGNVKA